MAKSTLHPVCAHMGHHSSNRLLTLCVCAATSMCVCLREEGHSAFHLKQAVKLSNCGPPPSFNGASQLQPDTSQRKSSARPDTTRNIYRIIITMYHLPRLFCTGWLRLSGYWKEKKKKKVCYLCNCDINEGIFNIECETWIFVCWQSLIDQESYSKSIFYYHKESP